MWRWLAVVALGFIFVAGCGSGHVPTYKVTGKVAFADGKPLAGSTIEFKLAGDGKNSATQVSSRGQVQADGTYTLSTFAPDDGAPAGEHRVSLTSPLPPGPINAMKPARPIINDKFLRPDTSGLKFTVTAQGPNEFDITVTPPGK